MCVLIVEDEATDAMLTGEVVVQGGQSVMGTAEGGLDPEEAQDCGEHQIGQALI
jgi:hypothetical protein